MKKRRFPFAYKPLSQANNSKVTASFDLLHLLKHLKTGNLQNFDLPRGTVSTSADCEDFHVYFMGVFDFY